MPFIVAVTDDHLEVILDGFDALWNFRRRLQVPLVNVAHAEIAIRADIERRVGARLLGRGRNDGWRKQGGRRVGPMLGATAQKEFWAVSEHAREVVWVTISGGEWSDVVVEHPEPESLVARLSRS